MLSTVIDSIYSQFKVLQYVHMGYMHAPLRLTNFYIMQFDWEGFINYIYVNLSGLAVPENLEIVVTTPDYFEKLGPLLQNTSQE